AGAVRRDGAAAGDEAAEGEGVGAIDREGAVVRQLAGDGSAGAAIAELQGAAGDRGAAAISVAAGEDQRSRTRLAQRAGAGDGGGERERVGEVRDDLTVVRDRRRDDRAGEPAGAEAE